MSEILYYSKNCSNCNKLLQNISRSRIKDKIHFICIDNRKIKQNRIFIVLENNQEIMLPPQVNRVPALLLINKNQILFGDDINNYLKPEENVLNNVSTNYQGEPDCFSFGLSACSTLNIMSDNFSFLDQPNDSLLAKGDGGMRQLYSYATINQNDNINTPPDNYSPDTVGNVTLEKLQQERNEVLK
jgi:glutaredoxin-related protein